METPGNTVGATQIRPMKSNSSEVYSNYGKQYLLEPDSLRPYSIPNRATTETEKSLAFVLGTLRLLRDKLVQHFW